MLIPSTNAVHYIGTINPGVGYWWVKQGDDWFLWLPEPQVINAFYPVFGLTAVCLFLGLYVIEKTYSRRR